MRDRAYGWLPRRAAVAALLLSLVSPAQAEPTTVTLPGEAVYPESITATADGTRFVSSFASGGVLRIAPGAAEGEIWIKPGAFGTRSTFGVLADEASGTLWVCSNDLSALGIKGPSEVPGSALTPTLIDQHAWAHWRNPMDVRPEVFDGVEFG